MEKMWKRPLVTGLVLPSIKAPAHSNYSTRGVVERVWRGGFNKMAKLDKCKRNVLILRLQKSI